MLGSSIVGPSPERVNLNVQFPRMAGYKSAAEAIAASKAQSAEFEWFDPGLAHGKVLEAASFGLDWFALRLSDGSRLTVRADGRVIRAGLALGPLPESEPLEREITLKYDAFEGPATQLWRPHEQAALMLGHKVFANTFHPHRLIIDCTHNFAIWFWLMHNKATGQALLKWTAGQE